MASQQILQSLMDDYNLGEIITIIFCHSTKFSFRNQHLVEQIELDLVRATAIRNSSPKHFTATDINALPSPVSAPKHIALSHALPCTSINVPYVIRSIRQRK